MIPDQTPVHLATLFAPMVILAERFANEIDLLTPETVFRVSGAMYLTNGRHEGFTPEGWADSWNRFPADLSATPEVSAWLRSLPELGTRILTSEWTTAGWGLTADEKDELRGEEHEYFLREFLFVEGNGTAFRRTTDSEAVRQGADPHGAAYFLFHAWDAFVSADLLACRAGLDLAQQRDDLVQL